MEPTTRQQQILAVLESEGVAAISELSVQLGVSDETIRRALKGLSENGIVEKFHGGVRMSRPPTELPFEKRLQEAAGIKARIAARTAEYICEGATVLLDNSSTACYLARELVHRERMSILTISIEVARIFAAANSHHRVILPGGELRAEDQTLTGLNTIEFLTRFTPTYFVTSVVAGSSRGCHDFDLFEAEFKQAMIPLAAQTIVMMDSSKFGKSGLIHVCNWSDVDVLVSDKVPEEIQVQLEHGHVLLVNDKDEA